MSGGRRPVAAHQTVTYVPAYVFGHEVFIRHPVLKRFYIRTHVCVTTQKCPTCAATPGLPCKNKKGDFISDTHYTRRNAYYGRKP